LGCVACATGWFRFVQGIDRQPVAVKHRGARPRPGNIFRADFVLTAEQSTCCTEQGRVGRDCVEVTEHEASRVRSPTVVCLIFFCESYLLLCLYTCFLLTKHLFLKEKIITFP
jgi:hypothetical protein